MEKENKKGLDIETYEGSGVITEKHFKKRKDWLKFELKEMLTKDSGALVDELVELERKDVIEEVFKDIEKSRWNDTFVLTDSGYNKIKKKWLEVE